MLPCGTEQVLITGECGCCMVWFNHFAIARERCSRRSGNMRIPSFFVCNHYEIFGPLVQYSPSTGDPKEESRRVSDVLYEHMQHLALEAGYRPMAALPQE